MHEMSIQEYKHKDIESPKELAMIIICYKNVQRIMTVFVAIDLGTKRKCQNTNVQNPDTINAPPSPKAPTPKPQTQKSVSNLLCKWRCAEMMFYKTFFLKDSSAHIPD